MKIIHNKLVRDNIPTIIKNSGKTCKVHTLTKQDYQDELKKKLLEEVNEVLEASSKEHLIEELADVLEVFMALQKSYEIDNESIEKVRTIKAKKNGAFNDQIYLEYVEEE